MVTGTGGAPRITVTAPDGETVSSGAGGGPAKGVHMVVYSTPQQNATTVLVGKPVPGNYTVTAQPGSPAIARVGNAHGLPAPSVTAKVTGRGHARRLRYAVKPISGQTVRFAERSAAAAADLGAARGRAARCASPRRRPEGQAPDRRARRAERRAAPRARGGELRRAAARPRGPAALRPRAPRRRAAQGDAGAERPTPRDTSCASACTTAPRTCSGPRREALARHPAAWRRGRSARSPSRG